MYTASLRAQSEDKKRLLECYVDDSKEEIPIKQILHNFGFLKKYNKSSKVFHVIFLFLVVQKKGVVESK